MDIYQIVFIILSTIVIGFALFAVLTEVVMRAAVGLLISLTGVAGIFLLANSEIMLALQISVYGGGISILILFAAVLIEHEYTLRDFPTLLSSGIIIALLALNFVLAVINANVDDVVLSSIVSSDDAFGVIHGFSLHFWTAIVHTLPFVALLMLSALLGAVRLALRESKTELEVAQ